MMLYCQLKFNTLIHILNFILPVILSIENRLNLRILILRFYRKSFNVIIYFSTCCVNSSSKDYTLIPEIAQCYN